MIGTILSNRYRVVSQLGKGGMGTVYLAHDPLLEREVAVKLLSPLTMSPNSDDRFRAEARIVAGMDHPGIVPVYDIGQHEGSLFIVMAYVAGDNLRSYIQEGRLTASEILQVGIQAGDALHHSHDRGVVHRDVKPENIIVTRESAGIRARITDFGLAVTGSQDRLTQSGSIVGTLSYLSPEQISNGAIDARADLYALGAVLYECFAGKPPIEGDFPGILYSILHETPVHLGGLRPDLPPELSDLIMTLLAKAASDRIESAGDLASMLRESLSSVTGRAGGVRQEASPEKRTARFPRVVRAGVSFIGRQPEFEELQRRVTASLLGECQLVLIGGEAGIGKSRLVEELQRLARVRDVATYRGRFIEQDRGFPYQPFGDILHEFFTRHPALLPDFADLLPELILLFPVLTEVQGVHRDSSERLLAPRPAEDQTHVFELLSKTIARIAGGKPLLLVIENMQAADVSVQAVQYLLGRLPNLPLVLVGTYRSSSLDRRHPIPRLVQNLRGERNFSSITLTGFSESEQRAFIESLIGGREIEDELATRLHAATEGNPYFTSELVRSLADAGAIAQDEDQVWRISRDDALSPEKLPETIHQVVERRLDKLDDETRSLLATASVLGRTFELNDLEFLSDRSRDMDEMIESLVAEGILEEERELRGDHFSFVSNVFRDVVYASIPRRKRKSLHLRFAAHLEEQFAGRIERVFAELLHHYASADAADKVIEYGPKAAVRYLDSFSALDAIRVLRLTLDMVSDDDEDRPVEARVRELLALAYRMSGQDEAALQELGQAARILEALDDRKQLTVVFALAAELAWETRQVDAAAGWIERGLAIRSDAEVATLRKLYSLGATVANLGGDTARAQACLQAAQSLPRERRSPTRHVSSGVLQIPISGDLVSLDPSLTFTLAQTEALPNIFESLTREAEGARIVPWLAAEYVGEGSRVYRFLLQRNLHFQDGRRVRSRDVLYSFNRLLRNPLCECRFVLSRVAGAEDVIAAKAESLAGFTAVSDEEFTIELARPVAFFPALLTNIAASIVPEGLENFVGTWRDGVVGTGPYRVVSFDPGRQLELEANPYYWRPELPRCRHLTFTFGLAPNEILNGFRDGHFSIASDLVAADVEPLRRDPRFARNYRETPRMATYFLALNSRRGPLMDEALRHRLIQCIDVRSLLKRTVGRLGVPAHGIIPPGLLGFDSSRTSQRFKHAEPVGDLNLSVMLNSAYRRAYSKFASLLLGNLNELGVMTEVVEGSSEYFQNQAEALGRVDLVLTRWIADYPDAHDFISFLHSDKGYVGKLCGRPDIDRLIEKGETESNPEIRREIYREVEELLRRHALLLPLFHEQSYRFARPEIEGFDLNFFSPVVPYERIWFSS